MQVKLLLLQNGSTRNTIKTTKLLRPIVSSVLPRQRTNATRKTSSNKQNSISLTIVPLRLTRPVLGAPTCHISSSVCSDINAAALKTWVTATLQRRGISLPQFAVVTVTRRILLIMIELMLFSSKTIAVKIKSIVGSRSMTWFFAILFVFISAM